MTGSTLAYGLRAEHAPDGTEPFVGALIRVGVDRDLNVAEALEAGDGRIVIAIDDHSAAIALDAFTPLKRVASSDDDELTITRWDGVSYADLQAEARRRELPLGGKGAELVARLVANDAELATGNITAQPRPAAVPPVEPNPATAAAAANAGDTAGDDTANAGDTAGDDTPPEA